MLDTDFLIKCKLRTEDRTEWLAIAQRQSEQRQQTSPETPPHERIDIGARAWYGEREIPLPGHPEMTLRALFRAIQRFAAADCQLLFSPEITIKVYWTPQ